jgi:hypothetical protein
VSPTVNTSPKPKEISRVKIYDFLQSCAIALVLCVTIAGIVIVTLQSGADSLAATGFKDLAILLGGGLLGAHVPKQ